MRKRNRKPNYREELETGNRVYRDSTEAMAWRSRLKKVRNLTLSKCPFCNGNVPSARFQEHVDACTRISGRGNGREIKESTHSGKTLNELIREQDTAREQARRKRFQEKKQKRDKKRRELGFVNCPTCGARIRRDRMDRHNRRVHKGKDFDSAPSRDKVPADAAEGPKYKSNDLDSELPDEYVICPACCKWISPAEFVAHVVSFHPDCVGKPWFTHDSDEIVDAEADEADSEEEEEYVICPACEKWISPSKFRAHVVSSHPGCRGETWFTQS